MQNCQPLAIFCRCTARSVSDMVGWKPNCRFSHAKAHLIIENTIAAASTNYNTCRSTLRQWSIYKHFNQYTFPDQVNTHPRQNTDHTTNTCYLCRPVSVASSSSPTGSFALQVFHHCEPNLPWMWTQILKS